MSKYFTRFSARDRIEHLLVMVLFAILALTGLPQKYHDAGWAVWIIERLGGIDRVRWIHRGAGLVFSALLVFHSMVGMVGILRGRTRPSVVPRRQDFRDALHSLRYYLGLADRPPRFDRYDPQQKFQYWMILLGGAVMVVTGFVLYFPIQVATWLGGQWIPAAKLAHGDEGLLAFLVVILWHTYTVHLSPDVFPFDSSIFTGRISRERLEREHPLEWERLGRRAKGAEGKEP